MNGAEAAAADSHDLDEIDDFDLDQASDLRGGTSTGGREAMYIGTSGFHEGRDEQSPCVALVDHVACRCRRPRDRRDVCDDIDWKTGLRALEGDLLMPEDAAALRIDSRVQ